MTKRKSDSGPILPRKRARLTQLDDASNPQTRHVFLAPPQPLSPAMPPRLEKRKRNGSNQLQTDSDEEPRAKRARTNHTSGNSTRRWSRSSSPELWPSIGYEPEQEKKPNLRVEAFHRAWIDAESVCSCQPQTVIRNPLPSPVPSDRDTSEPDGNEYAAIDDTPSPQNSTSIPQPSPSPNLPQTTLHCPSPLRRKRRSSRRRSAIPSPVSSQGKESQRQPRQKKNSHRQDKPLEHNDAPLIETILHSRRSSRRSSGCELWYLNDNGIACAVANSR
ncbi:hypothetical protein TGAMA5MH_00913 [Trichoderma gamsii]|uniref:Uncharacterized protein n=1 Tax=Trichoderma gamsii TaxID=398673 RepID=A0A2K0TQS1_9HYPO|nr:hypothetical protein TGAMA5MH_00913 [Trichoderma gamsii]